MTDQIKTALAEAELGLKIENFVESDVARYLEGCTKQDEQEAFDKLLDFDPYKYTTLGELQTALSEVQQNINIAKKVHGYLSDAIIRGRQAEEVLANIEDD